MKKYFYILFLSVLSIACSNDDSEKATIKLSENGTIVVSNEESNKIINIETNQKTWNSIASASWITLSQTENQLNINISANNGVDSRKAEIYVIAGNATDKIIISQKPSDFSVNNFLTNLEVNNWANEYRIDVESNSNKWSVETNAKEWLTVTALPQQKEIYIKIAENKNIEKREGIISIVDQSGNEESKLKITQDGKPHYIFPIMDHNATFDIIQTFEANRKSTLVYNVSTLQDPTKPIFSTQSEIFPQIQYLFTPEGLLTEAVILATSSKIIESAEYKKILAENGFKETSKANNYEKITDTDKGRNIIQAKIIIGTKSGVKFTYIPEQLEDMPTFDKLPLGYINFKEMSDTAIKEFEEQHNAEFDAVESGPIIENTIVKSFLFWFTFKNDPNSIVVRYYLLQRNLTTFIEGCEMFADVDKFFYKHNDIYYLTKEFSELLEKEGFQAFSVTQQGYQCFLRSDCLMIALKVRTYNKINNANPVVDLRFIDATEDLAQSNASLKDTSYPNNILDERINSRIHNIKFTEFK